MRRTAAALVLALSLALTACGQSAEESFRTHDLRPLQKKLELRQSELAVVLQSAHPGRRRDARAVARAVVAVAGTAHAVAALRPPSSVEDSFVRYTAANSRLVEALRRFAREMRGSDEARLGVASDAARTAAGEVRRAQDALEAALTH
jgi:hypothetical protein